MAPGRARGATRAVLVAQSQQGVCAQGSSCVCACVRVCVCMYVCVHACDTLLEGQGEGGLQLPRVLVQAVV